MVVRDIACPACGESGGIVKEGIGAYRCRDCGESFSPEDAAAA